MSFELAHVNVARGYRGGERQTELLIRALESRDVRQVLGAREGAPLAARCAAAGVDVREVSGQLLSVLSATRGADLVHVHEGRSIYAAYLRKLRSGTPYIATRRVDNRIKNHWLAHRAYRAATCVASVAPQVADVVRAFDPGVRVTVIYSASSGLTVDAAQAETIRRGFAAELVVGHVGALDHSQKGQEFIIEVARQLADTHPQLHFVLVGGGDDEQMLKRLAAGLTNITFTGFVDNVGDYLAAFDIFVLPSRREGIGSILFDAMEQGLPVVATRVGGVPEIVHDGENGILIDSERPDQLKEAILHLAQRPELRTAMGERGRRVAERYTASRMAQKYFELYEATLG